MPELPEVQTVINYLKTHILNKKIVDMWIYNDKFLKNASAIDFQKTLLNHSFINLRRKSKYLLFDMDNNYTLITHFRMEGKYFISSPDEINKHDYIVFKLDDNHLLKYNDSRQFGTLHLVETNKINELKEINKLAPDPFEDSFDFDKFQKKIQKSQKTIKNLLLDQSVIGGIGNIYACEILFDVKINPLTKGNKLTNEEIKKIFDSAKNILVKAIEQNGTTFQSFSFGNHHMGNFVNFLKVYGRNRQSCLTCGQTIAWEKINGRGTFYCPSCQK